MPLTVVAPPLTSRVLLDAKLAFLLAGQLFTVATMADIAIAVFQLIYVGMISVPLLKKSYNRVPSLRSVVACNIIISRGHMIVNRFRKNI